MYNDLTLIEVAVLKKVIENLNADESVPDGLSFGLCNINGTYYIYPTFDEVE